MREPSSLAVCQLPPGSDQLVTGWFVGHSELTTTLVSVLCVHSGTIARLTSLDPNAIMRCTGAAMNKQAVLAAVAICLLSVAFTQNSTELEDHGIVVANMDRSVKPGDDFYRYANGDWIKRTQIPPDRSDVGGFHSLIDVSQKRIAGLVKEAAKANAPAGSNTRKIADLYHSYMDESAIEAKGLAPLGPQLDAIAAIRDKHEMARALGESLRADVDPLNCGCFHTPNLFGLWVGPGFNDPEHYAAYLLQGGLEMPDREYYLSDSGSMRDIHSKYQTHVSAMLKLAGFAETDVRAKRIIELEHAIAEKHIPLADQQDVYKANNTWKQADFAANAPGLDWAAYFRGTGLSGQANFIVWSPQPLPESPLSLPLSRWTHGKTGWLFT
jgi:putative endopeptidase